MLMVKQFMYHLYMFSTSQDKSLIRKKCQIIIHSEANKIIQILFLNFDSSIHVWVYTFLFLIRPIAELSNSQQLHFFVR